MATTIKIKRGLKNDLPLLEIGELAYCTDTNELFIGKFVSEGVTENILINEDLDEYITNASFNTTNGELTLTKSDNSTVIVDLDGRYLKTYVDTNDYVDQASFSNGTLTLTRTDDGEVAISLDGRYLQVDENGLVPADKLPSYVDDVLEGYYNAAGDSLFYEDAGFTTPLYEAPNEGEQGKIYVDLASNASYRWTGSAYVEISSPLDFATEAEAIAGTNDTKAMSPLRTKQAITDFHPGQNQVSDADNSLNDNYIKSLTFDDYGHVTGVTSAEVSAGITVSSTQPSNAQIDDFWLDSTDNTLYVYGSAFPDDYSIALETPTQEDSAYFGASVSVNSNYILIGSPGTGTAGGTAYLYNLQGNLIHTFNNPNPSGSTDFDYFGQYTSINGTKAFVTAYGEGTPSSGTEGGYVYAFDLITGNLLYSIPDPDDAFNRFAYGIDSNDDYFVAGAYGTSKAWLFDESDGSVVHTFTNPNSNTTDTDDSFGQGVAINDNYITISAPKEDSSTVADAGVIYVYDTSTRNLVRTIQNPENSNDNFGIALDLYANKLLVGAYDFDDDNANSGIAYLFDLTDGSLIHTFNNPNAFGTTASDRFGYRLSINENYSFITAGFEDDDLGTTAAKVYVFDNNTGSLVKTFDNPNLYGSDTANERFGWGISSSNSTLVIGAENEDSTTNTTVGVAYVYSFEGFQEVTANGKKITASTTITEKTFNSIKFTITNNFAQTVYVEWSLSDGSQKGVLTLLSNETSQEIQLTSLTAETEYTIVTKFFAQDAVSNTLIFTEETLVEPFKLGTVSYSSTENFFHYYLNFITFNNDGTKLYTGDWFDDSGIYEYELSTPYDIQTKSLQRIYNLNVNVGQRRPFDMSFNNDGTKMFVIGSDPHRIDEFSLSTPYTVTTATLTSQETFSASSNGIEDPSSVTFNNDGTKLFVLDHRNDNIKTFTLSTGFDLSTIDPNFITSPSIGGGMEFPHMLKFNQDGSKMFISGNDDKGDLVEYNLTNNFDVSSFSRVKNVALPNLFIVANAVAFSADGSIILAADEREEKILSYTNVI